MYKIHFTYKNSEEYIDNILCKSVAVALKENLEDDSDFDNIWIEEPEDAEGKGV